MIAVLFDMNTVGLSEFPCASVSKRTFVQNLSYETEFDLHVTESVGGTNFHMSGLARRLVSKQRQKSTRKWPIAILFPYYNEEAIYGQEGNDQPSS